MLFCLLVLKEDPLKRILRIRGVENGKGIFFLLQCSIVNSADMKSFLKLDIDLNQNIQKCQVNMPKQIARDVWIYITCK